MLFFVSIVRVMRRLFQTIASFRRDSFEGQEVSQPSVQVQQLAFVFFQKKARLAESLLGLKRLLSYEKQSQVKILSHVNLKPVLVTFLLFEQLNF